MTKQRQSTPLLIAVLLACLLGLAATIILSQPHTRIVTQKIPVYPDPTARAGQAGLVAADRLFMTHQDALSLQRNVPTYTLGYIVSSASPTAGEVLNWVLTLVSGQTQWSSITTKYAWDGRHWIPRGIALIQPLGTTPNAYDKFSPFPVAA